MAKNGKAIAMSDDEIRNAAEKISKTISIRRYENGSSVDERRATTKVERDILYNIAYGAISALNREACLKEDDHFGKATQSVLSTAEYIFCAFFGTDNGDGTHANSYDSIYSPLMHLIYSFTWKTE